MNNTWSGLLVVSRLKGREEQVIREAVGDLVRVGCQTLLFSGIPPIDKRENGCFEIGRESKNWRIAKPPAVLGGGRRGKATRCPDPLVLRNPSDREG
ncbi:unnamed protein product [Linum trigynum]|uniref:Uncharacterized protein n=1 Tax=Linum trigynum TaxID=586398 RepID=A0AAV2F4D9_9ROSI